MTGITAILPACNEEVAIGSMVLRSKQHVDKGSVVDDGSRYITIKPQIHSTLFSNWYTKIKPQMNADKGAQSHGPPELRLGRAHTRMLTSIRGYQVEKRSFRSRRVHVCPAGHTCARTREPAGFRHDERRCGFSNITYMVQQEHSHQSPEVCR